MRKTLKINLALQGGGVHGAFTWGVLDRLLEDGDIGFGWVSAASAGTVNAVALAAGLAEGSREKARAKLFRIWEGVHKSGVPDFAKLNPFLNGFSRPASMAQIAKHRFHVVDGGEVTGALDFETTFKPDWNVITYLHGVGRNHAEVWLDQSRADIGRKDTVDLARHFFPRIGPGIGPGTGHGIAQGGKDDAIAVGPRGRSKKAAVAKRV